jgi:hypothetical protein
MHRDSLALTCLVLFSATQVFLGLESIHAQTAAHKGRFPFPSHAEIASGPWQVHLLPGRQVFNFTMYGCPDNREELRQLVDVMRQRQLGNSFDPGPTARASSRPLFEYLATVGWPMICYPGWSDMQVKEGRCRLQDDDEETLKILDRAGVFSAIQLGEWGYYFHNLSSVESWWRDVYGKDFEQYKQLMKPPGLKGYDRRPASRQECYEAVKDYFTTRNRFMRGRNMSVTGHSHYEAYAAEWGARVVGLELGENIAFTQSKIAFARGASRQWRRPWSVQVSPWFSGACTTSGPLRSEGGSARGLDAGHSLSLYERMWLHSWFAGAAMVTPENSIASFFESPHAPWRLTSHGMKAAEVFAFTQAHDRGVPFTPVAIVLDHLAGYNGYQDHPWGILDKTPGDQETYDLLERQIFPGSDHIHGTPDPRNPEASYLRPTPFGESIDVVLSSAAPEVLRSYPVILLAGDLAFEPQFAAALQQALRGGSKLLLHERHVHALGSRMAVLRDAGAVEILKPWTNPATGRPAAISNDRLAKLVAEYLPVAVEGDPVQYQTNRNRQGWVIELVNNRGVVKQPNQPAVVDPQAVVHVSLRPGFAVQAAREWRSNREFPPDGPLSVIIAPGQSLFIQLVVPAQETQPTNLQRVNGQPSQKAASSTQPWQDDLLTEKFTPPGSNCRGWGRWETPFVLANHGHETVGLLNGRIKVPPTSVLVHPGADRDAGIAWRSPIAGKINILARIAHADPSGGDGVSWTLIHDSKDGFKTLAQGMIDRGGSQSISAGAAAGKLADVAVEKDDAVCLIIGPRETHFCDSTVVDLTVTESGNRAQIWDVAKDLVADIQSSNPHSDSFGNKAVWCLVAPKRLTQVEDSLRVEGPKAGPRIRAWTIATDDTKLTVGATSDGQLVVWELSNPLAGWNWTKEPSVFPLVDKALISNVVRKIRWKFKDGTVDRSDGQKLELRFVCENPPLDLTSEWTARPGRGPVHHAMRIVNRSKGVVTLFDQPTIQLDLSPRIRDGDLSMWTFHSDGGTPDPVGVYRDLVHPRFALQVRTHPNGEFLPYAVFDAGGKQGVYVGIEWGYCRIAGVVPEQTTGGVRVRGGEFAGFSFEVGPGDAFRLPPGFVGAYQGDVDDAGNSLRRHLFNTSIPEVVRKDPTYPKVQWNAFGATGDKPGSWNSVESKYCPMVDAIAPLGFEEVMLDVGWWKGGTSAAEPDADPVDWPSGMAKAAEHAHKAGMRFGLYWNKGENMASPHGRAGRISQVRRLYNQYHADMWRSDCTAGDVVGGSYASFQGFYAMLDQLQREIPDFQWENCSGGGRIKDFGSMKRCVKIFITDTYFEQHVRQAFYDGSFAIPPAQLEGCVGSTDGLFRPKGPAGMRFAFRSTSLGAPEWFIDAPTGGNGSAPWTAEERAAVKLAVATYKTKIRPLVRNADLYHILSRPDGKHWDGIQYFDPANGKGVVYLFKPVAGSDTMMIRLRGLDPVLRYRVTFEDRSNPLLERTGLELSQGIEVTLKGAPVSELMWTEQVP